MSLSLQKHHLGLHVYCGTGADLDGNDEDNIEDVVSVVETKVGLVVLGTKGSSNLCSNDDIDARTDRVEDAHPDSIEQPAQSVVTNHRQENCQTGDEDGHKDPDDRKAFLKSDLIVSETPSYPGETVQQILPNGDLVIEVIIIDGL